MPRPVFAFLFAVVFAMGTLPVASTPARAVDVNVTLIASGFVWHVGSESSTETRITVTVGDTLRLRVENRDNTLHTFTVPQFSVDETLDGQGAVVFWNHTVTAADVGDWQFYCRPHSFGTYPNRTGMVGVVAFVAPSTPPAGIDLLLVGSILIVLVVVGAAVAVLVRRRRPPSP